MPAQAFPEIFGKPGGTVSHECSRVLTNTSALRPAEFVSIRVDLWYNNFNGCRAPAVAA
jgi:hypothetical protein